MRKPRHLWLMYVSIVVAVGVSVGTGLISEWGKWYSANMAYRRQTEALMRGSFTLGTDPRTLQYDMTWAGGGVQQVWGLGVPLWRLPFECMARLAGQEAFPDRLAFTLALALTTYFLLRHFNKNVVLDENIQPRTQTVASVAGVLLLVAFPPFVALCRTWFDVYEEAEAYAYLTAIVLFLGTRAFIKSPRRNYYAALTFVSGACAFVRPTLVFYGVASLVSAWLHTRRLGWTRLSSAIGVGSFALGLSLILVTNLSRFGSAFEFGHRLNMNGSDAMRFASRFDHPFRTEPSLSAARELLCLLFLTHSILLRQSGYDMDLFPGQAETFRWRDLYFSTYDLATFAVVTSGWFWSMLMVFRRSQNRRTHDGPPLWASMGIWSLMSTIPMILFYLRFPFISSRYLLDFGPAFAVSMWVCVQAINHVMRERLRWRACSTYMLCVLVVWWGYEVLSPSFSFRNSIPSVVDLRDLIIRLKPELPAKQPPPVVGYSLGTDARDFVNHYNGVGWDPITGEVKAAVAFFIRDPEFLELDVSRASGATIEERDWLCIRAKIGLEFLNLRTIQETSNGRRLVFERPRRKPYQSGLQLVFLGFVSAEELSEAAVSKFRLLRVRWQGSPQPP